jgi:phage major head subunit gpT-like protein
MITRKDIAAHLEYGVRRNFLNGRQAYTPLRTPFVREVTSAGAFETYADMGDPPWPVQNAGKEGAGGTDPRTGAPQVNKMNAGGPITILGAESRGLIVYNVDWEIAIAVEHNAIDDDRTGTLDAWARDAGTNFEKYLDFKAFDALNQGEATTAYGAGFDGLSFFNDAHIYPGAEYATAQDNRHALALTLDNFETVITTAAGYRDSRGQPLGNNYNLLVVPPSLAREAAQIAVNPNNSATANNEINPYSGQVRFVVAPGGWLDATSWFVMDVSQTQKPLILQIRKRPELTVWDDETQGSGVRYFKWHMRGALAYGNWTLAAQGNT